MRVMMSLICLVGLLFAPVAFAQDGSGLPLPRYQSLRAGEVNMRTGPGLRYPIVWRVQRRDLPVEVIEEYQQWRKVRDPVGDEGWMHMRMLSGQRTALVTGDSPASLRDDPSPRGNPVALVEPGVVVTLVRCEADAITCLVEADAFRGYLYRSVLWGLYAGEVLP